MTKSRPRPEQHSVPTELKSSHSEVLKELKSSHSEVPKELKSSLGIEDTVPMSIPGAIPEKSSYSGEYKNVQAFSVFQINVRPEFLKNKAETTAEQTKPNNFSMSKTSP